MVMEVIMTVIEGHHRIDRRIVGMSDRKGDGGE